MAFPVQLVLAHVRDGSALPPELVSPSLLQRHRFLGLTPENPAEYLAWPSDEQTRLVHLLETQPWPAPDEQLAVRYTADAEHITAHVRITSDLRLLFLSDAENRWQYHNLASMPFPANSHLSLEDALPPREQPRIAADDDDYWDAYGRDDHHQDSSSPSLLHLPHNSEDAYWAQYASVQGSADSTVPSPRPLNTKASSDPERVVLPSDNFLVRIETYNPLEPPTPDSLARRLADLRSRSPSPPPFEQSPTTDSDPMASPKQPLADITRQNPPSVDNASSDSDLLSGHLQSLFKLWRATRQGNTIDDDKAIFLSAAHHALSQL